MSLGWPGNASGSPRKSWMKLGSLGFSAHPSAPTTRTWISGGEWIEGMDVCSVYPQGYQTDSRVLDSDSYFYALESLVCLSELFARVFNQQALRQAVKIINDPSHILYPAFQWLPSGQGPRCTACMTERTRATFVPKATLFFNSSC